MAALPTLKHKHVRIDQRKLDRAKEILEAETETQTLDRALELVVAEGEIDGALRAVKGRTKLQKVFE